MILRFVVYGHPEPQGSTRAFIPKGWKRPIITSANPKQKPQRQQVAAMALVAMREAGFECAGREVPMVVTLRFFFAKPKSARKRDLFNTKKPDADKLARLVLDSLTGTVFHDDAQVVRLIAEKHYGEPERTEIEVRAIQDNLGLEFLAGEKLTEIATHVN